MPLSVEVGARGSKLSRAQISEVLEELRRFHPDISFSPTWVDTTGDCDRITSLRTLEKSDFFTRQIDDLLLAGKFRIAIHSAKDLPEPLRTGLQLVALTSGINPADALVFNQELPLGAKIGTSSLRREEILKKWRPDLQCVDIRGNVDERLALLDQGIFDGVVVAEAALIRLGLAYRKRILLEGEVAPLQGRLAVVARQDDSEMETLFRSINS